MTDEKNWVSLKNGSREALKLIYDDHIDALLQYGLRFSKNKQLVHDCVHDLFVYIWEKRGSLSSTDSIRRYLLVALRRRIIKAIGGKTISYQDQEIPFEAEISFEQQVINREQQMQDHAQLQTALATLSNRQKEAVFLKYYKGLRYEDISEIMSINNQSARNLVASGIKALRKLMMPLKVIFYLIMST